MVYIINLIIISSFEKVHTKTRRGRGGEKKTDHIGNDGGERGGGERREGLQEKMMVWGAGKGTRV
jgi:hypothetical protein